MKTILATGESQRGSGLGSVLLSHRHLSRLIDEELVFRGLHVIATGVAKEPSSKPNDRAAARAVLRGARLQAVANWLREGVEAKLAGLEEALASELAQDDPAANGTERLFANAEKRINNVMAAAQKSFLAGFSSLAEALAATGHHRFAEHGIGAQRKASDQFSQTAAQVTVLGLTIPETFEKLAADTLARFKVAVRTGLAAGENSAQLAQRIRGESRQVKASELKAADTALEVLSRLLDPTENGVAKFIESAVHSLARDLDDGLLSSLMEDEGNADKAMGWQWVAVLDDRTCPRCEAYDGNRWDEDYEPVADAPAYPEDPPLHPNCRCSLVPVDLNAEPAEDKTLDQYLGQFSAKEQESAFGKSAFRAYSRGDISASQMIGQQDHSLSPDEFKELEAAFKGGAE